MLSASQIAGFLNQLFLQNKSIKESFSYKFTKIESCLKNFLLGMVKIWVWPIWSLDSKLTVYLKNAQMELPDFLHAGTDSCKLKDNWKYLTGC